MKMLLLSHLWHTCQINTVSTGIRLWQVQKKCMLREEALSNQEWAKTPSVCCNWATLFPLWKLWPSSHPHALNALHVPATRANGPTRAGTGTSVWLAAKVCSNAAWISRFSCRFPESYQKHSFFQKLRPNAWKISFIKTHQGFMLRLPVSDCVFLFSQLDRIIMRSSLHSRSVVSASIHVLSSVSGETGKCLLNLAQKKGFEGHSCWAECRQRLRTTSRSHRWT